MLLPLPKHLWCIPKKGPLKEADTFGVILKMLLSNRPMWLRFWIFLTNCLVPNKLNLTIYRRIYIQFIFHRLVYYNMLLTVFRINTSHLPWQSVTGRISQDGRRSHFLSWAQFSTQKWPHEALPSNQQWPALRLTVHWDIWSQECKIFL